MAITTGAKKAIRQAARRRVFNLRRNTAMKTAIKEIRSLVSAKKIDEAKKALATAYKAIDKAAQTQFIKKQTASRKKSRLALLLAKAAKAV